MPTHDRLSRRKKKLLPNSAPMTRNATSTGTSYFPSEFEDTHSAPQHNEDHPEANFGNTPVEFAGTPVYNETREHLVKELEPLNRGTLLWANIEDSSERYTGKPFPIPSKGWTDNEEADFKASVEYWHFRVPPPAKVMKERSKETYIQNMWEKRVQKKVSHWVESNAAAGTLIRREEDLARTWSTTDQDSTLATSARSRANSAERDSESSQGLAFAIYEYVGGDTSDSDSSSGLWMAPVRRPPLPQDLQPQVLDQQTAPSGPNPPDVPRPQLRLNIPSQSIQQIPGASRSEPARSVKSSTPHSERQKWNG